MAPIPHVVEHSLQLPTAQNASRLTVSPADSLGFCCRSFWPLERPPLGKEEGFLAREVELVFLGVTAGFLSLIIFTVGWGGAAVVNGFLVVVEGAGVTLESLYTGVVRGFLGVPRLNGLTRGVVW